MDITILTPTYNRAHTLKRLYESLESQTVKNFEWLIIDDGSSDSTKKIIEKLIPFSSFPIRYIYKTNGGKHTAVNVGMKVIKSDLTFIVDSDDLLVKDAVELIIKKWNYYRNKKNISSIWFLIQDAKGKIIGDRFPEDELISSYTDLLINQGIKGDKKAVYVTRIRKKYEFPVFKDENFIGESTVHKLISNDYDCVFINEAIYIGEYLEDGLSAAGKKMRIKNSKGGIVNSEVFLSKDVKASYRSKKIILYTVYSLFERTKKSKIITGSLDPLKTFILFPISYLLYRSWKKM